MDAAQQLRDGKETGGAADARLRSMAPTLPGAGAPRTDADPPSSRVRRVEWCVDFENHLGTMTTLELWLAIASGRVVRGQRVWREGMECWVPAEYVSELRCAFRDDDATAEPLDAQEHLPAHDTELTPPPDTVASMTPGPLPSAGDLTAAARRVAPDVATVADVTSVQPLPLVRRRPRLARSHAVAIGASLAAVLVLGMGLASTDGPPSSPVVARDGVGEPPLERPLESEIASSPVAPEAPLPAVGQSSVGELPAPGPVSPRGHDEPGQRRLRRGSR